MKKKPVLAMIIAVQAVACSDRIILQDAGLDAGVDAWIDTGYHDAGDASADADSPDAHTDTGIDGGADAGTGGRICEETDPPGESKIMKWVSIASSADGKKLHAIAEGDALYFSKDYGNKWMRSSAEIKGLTSISSSADGERLVLTTQNGSVFISKDGGRNWTEKFRVPEKNFYVARSSSSGMDLVAIASDTVFSSRDGGDTWVAQDSTADKNFVDIVISSDGMVLVAAPWGGYANDPKNVYLYRSKDHGRTWTELKGAGTCNWWTSMAVSSDGKKMAVVCHTKSMGNRKLVVSDDSGESWKTKYMEEDIDSIFVSADGLRLVATGFMVVNISSDGGVNWSKAASDFHSHNLIVGSSDGMKLLSATYEYLAFMYLSDDGGESWSRAVGAGGRDWTLVTSSADGKNIAAALSPGGISLSKDRGINWSVYKPEGSPSWSFLVFSSDGNRLTAFDDFNDIVISSLDGGETWEKKTIPFAKFSGFTSSSNGKVQAIIKDNSVFLSFDGGETWDEASNIPGCDVLLLKISDDGGAVFASGSCAYPSGPAVFLSTDRGETWQEILDGQFAQTNFERWQVVAPDGSHIAVFDDEYAGKELAISSDGGLGWTKQTSPTGFFHAVAFSGDGL